MFRQKNANYSIKDIMDSPQSFTFSGGSSWSVNESSYGMEHDKHGTGELCVRSIRDFDTPSFNIRRVCELWSHDHRSGSAGIPSLLGLFFRRVKSSNQCEKNRYLKQFFGDITYQEIKKIDGRVAPALMRILFDWGSVRSIYDTQARPDQARYHGLDTIPRILLEYADDLAQELTVFPQQLTDQFSLLDTTNACIYQSMPLNSRGIHMEGSWDDKPLDKATMDAVKAKLPGKNEMPSQAELRQLKDLILEQAKKDHQHQYPVPEPVSWLHKEKFLHCLKIIEEMAYVDKNEIRSLLALRIKDEAILHNLLIANLGHNSFSCYNPEILPIGYVTYKEYFLEMPDESRLSWTSGLSAYVDKFNVVPSFEFLSEFSNFLEYCKTTYLKAADSLKDYLLEHPLDLGMQDKSHSMRF